MPDCPVDVPGAPRPAGAAGGATRARLGVGALAIMPEGDRAYVGAARSPSSPPWRSRAGRARQAARDRRGPWPRTPGGSRACACRSTPTVRPAARRAVRGQAGHVPLRLRPGRLGAGGRPEPHAGRAGSASATSTSTPTLCSGTSMRLLIRSASDARAGCWRPAPGLRIPVSEQPEVAPPVPVDIAFAQVGIVPDRLPAGLERPDLPRGLEGRGRPSR